MPNAVCNKQTLIMTKRLQPKQLQCASYRRHASTPMSAGYTFLSATGGEQQKAANDASIDQLRDSAVRTST